MGRQLPSANPAVCKEAEQCWLATYAYDIPTPTTAYGSNVSHLSV
jgi:hypothetical protein